jgi:hypothetical protein
MKKIIYVLGILILTASCSEDSLTNINTDEKNPSAVPAYSLFTNAEKATADQVTSTNVNRNIFRLVNQQWTETTYLDESNYEWTPRKISDNHWNAIYAGPLADLNQAKTYLSNDVIAATDPAFATKTIIRRNQMALIDIMMVYNFQILVDTFGDVPYTEALKGDADYLPKYDKQIDIYADLVLRLNKDLAAIDLTTAGFGTADVIFKDDLKLWKKFANSIKLKLGVNLKSAGNPSADAIITSAVTAGVIASNADNAKVAYMHDSPNTNPLYVDMVASERHDFVPAKPFVDAIVALNDPRKSAYFAENLGPDTYVGGNVGLKNSYGSKTHVSDKIQAQEFSATLLDYAEVEFLLAEVDARSGNAAAAEIHYNKAITASMEDWGVAIGSYLSKPEVAYTNILSGATWQEKIGKQAWYAMYNRGFEGWTFTRRLNFPALAASATPAATANGKIPVRMTYPIREQTLNPTNYNAAVQSNGGDKLETPLFWDK